MIQRICSAVALALVFTLATLGIAATDDPQPIDAGKAADFKGKTFELGAKGEAAILLSCTAGKTLIATTTGEKETDVHLFVYGPDKKEVGKDVSPGPKCEVKFTPATDGSFRLLVRNLGPGANKVTLKVEPAK
jgi:hypothetical protein